jgi:class 3 adenylate cyclase/pimeloyl-ACP methyl ester carboxylesterase
VSGVPETRYATTHDGVSIAYQIVGEGPVDLVLGLSDWGNVETMWELDAHAELFERLSRFSRLVLHDRRGTGLSGGGSFPNLETRAQDLLAVLDSIRSPKAALFGEGTQGSAFAVLAASHPNRVSSLVWYRAVATTRWSPEYPWGGTVDQVREAVDWVRAKMGTTELAREWLTRAAPSLAGDEQLEATVSRLDRHFMAPSSAAEWMYVENQTDVTAVLPLLRCPTLVLDYEKSARSPAESRHVHSMIPSAQLQLISGDPSSARKREFLLPYADRAQIAAAVEAFITRERPSDTQGTVLGTVLFTDIVGSTERQAAAGDREWADVIRQHHAIVRETLELWQGVENDTAGDGFYATFDGPARAIRCALDIVSRIGKIGLEIRAGIHTGECELVDGKRAGLAVTIGSRVAANAGPREVLVSRTVKDLTAGSGFSFEDRGEHELKGVPERWRLYRVSA